MALAGTHIVCAYVGARGYPETFRTALLATPQWSQTMASPGTTDNASPEVTDAASPCFEVRSSQDIYVAIGVSPDAATGPRTFVPANETRNIYCRRGDRLAWIAA